MLTPNQDLERRRPVWEALSDIFLDTELENSGRIYIAQQIIASNYAPLEIHHILWNEIYPVLKSNLQSVAGVWSGFNIDNLEQQILSGKHRRTFLSRLFEISPLSPAHIVKSEWLALLPFLPDHFSNA